MEQRDSTQPIWDITGTSAATQFHPACLFICDSNISMKPISQETLNSHFSVVSYNLF